MLHSSDPLILISRNANIQCSQGGVYLKNHGNMTMPITQLRYSTRVKTTLAYSSDSAPFMILTKNFSYVYGILHEVAIVECRSTTLSLIRKQSVNFINAWRAH